MPRLTVMKEFVEQTLVVETERELYALLEAITLEIGFRHFALVDHVDLSQPRSDIIRLSNYPEPWLTYFIDNGLYRIDPILQASSVSTVGFVWSDVPRMIRMTDRQWVILDAAAQHGLSAGFTVPAHIPGEVGGSCSFGTSVGKEPPREDLLLVQLIGAFAYQAARRLKNRDRFPRTTLRPLSPRQRECLVQIARGKTNKEIARYLHRSEKTVARHIEIVFRRYNLTGRLSLAVRALYEGQISFAEVLAPEFGQPTE